MPGARRSPGWYPDPDDIALLRYWSGRSWSHRRRVRPPWSLATAELELDTELPVLEGPAHIDALAANVAPPTVTRQQVPRVRATPTRWSTAWDDPRATALGRPPRLPSGRGAWVRPRRPFVVAGAMLAVALLVVASSTGLGERAPSRVVTAAFAAQANQLCQTELAPTVTPATGLAGGTGGSSPGARRGKTSAGAGTGGAGRGAGEAQQALAEVQPVVARLGALAARIDDKPDVNAWVGAWRQWVTDERAYLASRQSGAGAGNQSLASEAEMDAQRADQFAFANGLRSCLLAPRAAASTVAVDQ